MQHGLVCPQKQNVFTLLVLVSWFLPAMMFLFASVFASLQPHPFSYQPVCDVCFQALELLPAGIPIMEIHQFLCHVLSKQTVRRRNQQMLKSLLLSELLEVSVRCHLWCVMSYQNNYQPVHGLAVTATEPKGWQRQKAVNTIRFHLLWPYAHVVFFLFFPNLHHLQIMSCHTICEWVSCAHAIS